MYVYKLINTKTGKLYIGKSEDPNENARWSRHMYQLKKGTHKNYLLREAYKRTSGKKDWAYEIIDRTATTAEELNEREIYWIAFYRSEDPNYGYNMTPGGDFGPGTWNHRPKGVTPTEKKKDDTVEKKKEENEIVLGKDTVIEIFSRIARLEMAVTGKPIPQDDPYVKPLPDSEPFIPKHLLRG